MPGITTKEQIRNEFENQGLAEDSSLIILALRQITESKTKIDKKFGRRLRQKGHHLDYTASETLAILQELNAMISVSTTPAQNLLRYGLRKENIDLAITRLV